MGHADDVGMPYSDEDGRVAARVSIAPADLTQLAGELRHDSVMRAIVDHLGEGVAVLDANRQIVFLNPAAENMLGWTQAELLGKDAHATLHYQHADGAPFPVDDCPLVRVLATGLTAQIAEDAFVRQDGAFLPVAYTATPVREGERVIGVVLSFHDITERQRLAAERDTLLRQEQAARQAAEDAIRERDALQALTDTALAHLELDALLPEILDRVRAVMRVDNAAILLLSDEDQTLRVRAVLGPEAAVAEQVAVPLGMGFAGRIAATGEPLIVTDSHSFPAHNPFLREKLRSLVGVPLVIAGQVKGVLHVGTAHPHLFTAFEVELLERAATRVALAIERAMLYAAEQRMRREYEAIFETIPDGFALYNLEGQPIRINPALRALLALDHDPAYADLTVPERFQHLRARNMAGQLLTAAEHPLFQLLNGRRLNGATPQDLYVTALDGRELCLSVSGTILYDETGAPNGAILAYRDISERIRLEHELEEHARKLEGIIETMGDAVTLFDAQGKVVQNNAQARDLLGYHAMPIDFDRLSVIDRGNAYLPRDGQGNPLPQDQWPMMRILRGEKLTGANTADMILMTLDGRLVHFDVSGMPLRDSAGRVTGGVTVARDVTERRQLEIAAHKQAIRLRALEAADTIGVAIADATHFTKVNDAFLRIVGYSRADVAARQLGWAEMTIPEHAPFDRQAQAELHATGSCTPYEKDVWRKDGSRVTILASAALVERDPPEYVCVVLDLTAQKRLERERGQMLHIVGHELRTPLTSLKARIQLLQRRLVKTQHPDAELVAKAATDVDRLHRLVNDLNEGAQLERGKFTLALAETDLVALCREVAAEHTRASGRRIQLDLPKGSLVALADKQRVQQVLTNLLNNAAKYTPAEASITLWLRRDDSQARIEVRDTGPGIPEEAMPRLFERFYRAPGVETLTGSHVGLGLGLYIAQTLVQAHEGQMGVTSQVGAGTTFWLTLPLGQET